MIVTNNGPQNVGQVSTFFQLGDLFLSPVEYQREGVWNWNQKRLLIDTIFRKMDIPKLYLWKIDQQTLSSENYPDGETKDVYKEILERKRKENDDPNPYVFEVVDGQQRLRTILEYKGINPPNDKVYRDVWQKPFAAAPDTPMAKGKKYEQLNAAQQIEFDQGYLTIMVIENASIEEIRDMFLRLQNGTPLKAQQKRDAMGSNIGKVAQELAKLPFFRRTVDFDNKEGEHHVVTSQMLYLELKGRIVRCNSQRLDPLYEQYRFAPVDPHAVSKVKRVVETLGKVFPEKNPHLNRRSYVLGLYWALSRILEVYDLEKNDYGKIRENFEKLDTARLEAAARDHSNEPEDAIYAELTESMSRGTDSVDKISARHDILSQFLFEGIQLTPKPTLDLKRSFTHEEKLILYRRMEGRCHLAYESKICGRSINFDDAVVDHILPHSKGGDTTLNNGRIAFKDCNAARSNQDNFNPETMCRLLSNASK